MGSFFNIPLHANSHTCKVLVSSMLNPTPSLWNRRRYRYDSEYKSTALATPKHSGMLQSVIGLEGFAMLNVQSMRAKSMHALDLLVPKIETELAHLLIVHGLN